MITGKQKEKCFDAWEDLNSEAVEDAPKITTMTMGERDYDGEE